MAIQPDGKVLLVGGKPYGGPGTIVRFDRDGKPNPGFGEGGIIREPRATGSFDAVTVLPSGEILAGGTHSSLGEGSTPRPLFARFQPDGAVASGFGMKGIVELELEGGGRPTVLIPGIDGSATVGMTEWSRAPVRGGGIESIHGSVVEVGSTGGLSPAIGRNPRGSVSDMVPLPDGSLVAVGAEREPPNSVQLAHFIRGSENEYDPAFGEGQGLVAGQAGTTPFAERIVEEKAPDLVVDQGRLLVVGGEAVEGHPRGEEGYPLLARFSQAGTLDPGFGEGGVVKPTVPGLPGSLATGAAVQPNGRIVVALTTVPSDYGPPTEENETHEAFLERFLPDGTLDSSFGSDGVVHVAPADGNLLMVAEDVAVLPSGQIVLGGTTPDAATLIAARVSEDGVLDPSFGEDGITAVTPCPGKGCGPEIGHARVNLKNLNGRRKPYLVIHLKAAGPPSAKIDSVALSLPHALRFRPRLISTNAEVRPEFGDTQLSAKRSSAVASKMRNESVTLIFGWGLLRAMHRISHRARLEFRLKVGFEACPCAFYGGTASSQELVLHVPGGPKR